MSFSSIYHSLWIKKLSMAVVVASSGFAIGNTWSASVDQPTLPVNPDAVANQVVHHIPSQGQIMGQVNDVRGEALGTVATAQDAAGMARSLADAKVAEVQGKAAQTVAQAQSTVASTKSQVESQVEGVQSQVNGLVDQATGAVEGLQGQVDGTVASLPTVDQLTGQVTSLIPGQLPLSEQQILDAANSNLPRISGGATVNNNGTSPDYTINLSVSK